MKSSNAREIPGSKEDVIKDLEMIYRKWVTDNSACISKRLKFFNMIYEFQSPVELYRFMQGARFVLELKVIDHTPIKRTPRKKVAID